MLNSENRQNGVDNAHDRDAVAQQMLEIAQDLALGLHPHRRGTLRVNLDSTLDRDLGLDSLGRVELLLRLERTFKVHLGEQLLAEVQTLRELLDAVQRAGRIAPVAMPSQAAVVLEPVQTTPVEARTLLEVLDWHVANHPDRLHVRLEDADERGETITYQALRDRALAVAGGLCGRRRDHA